MASRKVAITLPEELYDMVERLRAIEHRTRSEVVQEALRTHFGAPVYRATEAELAALDEALDDVRTAPSAGRSWSDVRADLWPDR